jgi:hypothetical protein
MNSPASIKRRSRSIGKVKLGLIFGTFVLILLFVQVQLSIQYSVAKDGEKAMVALSSLLKSTRSDNTGTTRSSKGLPSNPKKSNSTKSSSSIIITTDNRLRPNSKMSRDTFCLPWTVNADDWWTRHPNWEASMENDTHYCFSPVSQPAKARLFRQLYQNQFKGDCSNGVTQSMYSSGWGADFAHVADALLYGSRKQRPVQVSDHNPWHFAAKKDGSQAACPLKSMYCYFLNLTHCPPRNDQAFQGNATHQFFLGHPDLAGNLAQRLIEYATRPQTWLRKAVYDFSKRVPLTQPCSVLHVRRSDVVLHDQHSRRYHEMEEYMNVSEALLQRTILLLTDDSDAIEEARTKYPDYHWVYIDRPRFKGTEGGWENQIPSDDPKLEIVVLLSIFRLVKQCQSFVHTHSNLGSFIAGIMTTKVPNATVVDIDSKENHTQVFSKKNEVKLPKKTKKKPEDKDAE